MSAEAQEIVEVEEHQVTPINTEDAMVSMIERMALDPSVSLDRIEQMMGMKERWEDRRAEKEYSEAMAAAQAGMPQVRRNQRNNQTNSRYADLDAVDEAMKPVITKHGFGLSFSPAQSAVENHYGIKCIVTHKGGHKVEHVTDIPVDDKGIKGTVNKTKTHAFGSTM